MGGNAGADREDGTITSTATGRRSGRWRTSLKGFSLERVSIGLRATASWLIQALRSLWSSARSVVRSEINLFSQEWKSTSVIVKLDFTRWYIGITWVDFRDILPGSGAWWLFVYPFPCVVVMVGF